MLFFKCANIVTKKSVYKNILQPNTHILHTAYSNVPQFIRPLWNACYFQYYFYHSLILLHIFVESFFDYLI